MDTHKNQERNSERTRWAIHINVCKIKVAYKWPTVVASLVLIACLVTGNKKKLSKEIRLYIFDDGVAAGDFF